MEKRRDGQLLAKEGEMAGSSVSVWEMVRRVGERGSEHVCQGVEPINRITLGFDSSKPEVSGRSRSGVTSLCSLWSLRTLGFQGCLLLHPSSRGLKYRRLGREEGCAVLMSVLFLRPTLPRHWEHHLSLRVRESSQHTDCKVKCGQQRALIHKEGK